MTPESLIAFNVGPRPAPFILRSLRQLNRDERPEAFALFEAHRALRLIRVAFSHNWRIYATDDVVLMVRKRCDQPEVRPFGHQEDWWGPKGGIAHEGREHMGVDWPDGSLWALMHGVPGGPRGGVNEHLARPGEHYGRNRPAWVADERALAKVLREHRAAREDDDSEDELVAGDLNAERVELASRWDALNLRPLMTRAHVDQAAESGNEWRATRLENYGSDHPAIRYDVTR